MTNTPKTQTLNQNQMTHTSNLKILIGKMMNTTDMKTASVDLANMDTSSFDAMLAMMSGKSMIDALEELDLRWPDDGYPDSYFAKRDLGEKEAYLAHRTLVKRCIRLLAAQQAADRKITSDGTLNESQRCSAHNRRRNTAYTISKLIALRRAGKVWSARQSNDLYRKEQTVLVRARISDLLGDGFDAKKPDAYFAHKGITTKAQYLAHRDEVKSLIKAQTALQVADLKLTRSKGNIHPWTVRSYAQSRLVVRAISLTTLIEIRRAGKVWSTAQRAEQAAGENQAA